MLFRLSAGIVFITEMEHGKRCSFMDFQEIGVKELKELNLYPIFKFKEYKECDKYGHYAIRRSTGNGTFREGIVEICTPPYTSPSECWDILERIELKPFVDMDKDGFEKFGFKGKSLLKLLWLQKYLRGEVVGQYEATEDVLLQSMRESEEFSKKEKTIQRLNSQLLEEKAKNKELQQKIRILENKVKEADKLKSKLLKFIEANKKFLEDYSSNLN